MNSTKLKREKIFSIEIPENRVYGLDILRALAITFVLIGHGSFLLPEQFDFFHQIIVFDGVSIFFVLSGFLIGGIIIKTFDKSKPNVKLLFKFWIRRWFRTLPNYYLTVFILLIFSLFYNDSHPAVAKYFFFAQNLFYKHPDFFPEAWSLSVEEWFYLITPIYILALIYFLKINTKQSLLWVAVSILLFSLAMRYVKYINHIQIYSIDEWEKIFAKQVITRMDSLMFGLLAAFLQYFNKPFWIKYKKSFLVAGLTIFILEKIFYLIGIFSYKSISVSIFYFTVISIATALLLPYFSHLKYGEGKLYKAITIISLTSYSMYLLNLSVVQYNIIEKIPWKDFIANKYLLVFLRYGIYWVLTFFGAIVIYKYYEIPTTKLREHKWFKKN